MPKRKPQDKLLTNHVQVLFSDSEYAQLRALSLNSQAEGNLSKFVRMIVLQAIRSVAIETSEPTAATVAE